MNEDVKINNTRKDDLLAVLNSLHAETKTTLLPLVDEVCFLEERLAELRKLPSIEISDTGKSRITAAGKQYKELFQSYTNALKVIQSALLKFSEEDEDEFEKWKREQQENLS